MDINVISMRFMRRIQVAQYEPAEVEFELHATLEDGEDHIEAGKQLAQDAREMIKDAFTGLVNRAKEETEAPQPVVNNNTSVETTAPPAAATRKRGRPAGSKNKPKENTSEIPGEDSPPLADADLSAEADGSEIPSEAPSESNGAAPVSEIPGDDGPTMDGPPVEEQFAVFDLAKLTAYVNDIVTVEKKLTGIQIKEVYRSFGVTRTVDIKKEDVEKVKTAIDILIEQTAPPVKES